MTSNRWIILGVLFFARMTMAFQFQSVAALTPFVVEDYGLNLADVGFLIGLYLAPGVVVAIPGGAISARFGDKRVVSLSLVAMLAGSALIVWSPSWSGLMAGRLLSGAGGVVVNIVMTKMLVDWFSGREISTAMAIFINSWPVGIALALLSLPAIATIGGLWLAWIAVVAVIALGLVLFGLVYHPPTGAGTEAAQGTVQIRSLPTFALGLAGLIWAFYNTALAMLFSFGPAVLSEHDWSLAAASSMTSAFMIVFSLSVPLGGVLADRTGRRDTIIAVSLLSYVILMPLVSFAPDWAVAATFLAVGLAFGLAAGPIMTLPSTVLHPEARSFGMGVFFSIYYAVMMLAPSFAGSMADRTGSISVAFTIGAGCLVAALIALWIFRGRSTA